MRCRIFAITGDNSLNNSSSYIKLYNLQSGSTQVGTTSPMIVLRVPANKIVTQEFATASDPGLVFDTAATVCAVTSGGVGGSTPAANNIVVSVEYGRG
jgi:hypothetical protein